MTEHRGFGPVGVPYYGAEGEDYDYYESGDYARDVEEANWEAYYAALELEREAEEEELDRRRAEDDLFPIEESEDR